MKTWNFKVYPEMESTNDFCKHLPPWTAVRAERQTGGRGRHGRAWVSGEGGLWLSAVIPAPEPHQQWEALPLTVGWVLLETLRKLGGGGARLRWPNDIMIRDQKLCGILVERFSNKTAVIGIGMNVRNHPGDTDPALKSITTCLANLIQTPPDLDSLAKTILKKIQTMQQLIAREGWAVYRDSINQSWGEPRCVECDLGETTARGVFAGVDPEGNLLLRDSSTTTCTLNATQVRLLREID